MKKKIQSFLSLISFTAIGMSSMAWADAPVTPAQPSLAEATQAVAGEVNVTHDLVDQMLRRMANQSASIEFNARDYRSKSARFQADVARVMQAFEVQMKESILRKLGYFAQRYNSIYNSTTLSAEQKQQILSGQLQTIRGQVGLIEQEYQSAIKGLYQAVGDIPFQMGVRYEGRPSFRDRRQHDCPRDTRGYMELSFTAPQSGRRVMESLCQSDHDSHYFFNGTGVSRVGFHSSGDRSEGRTFRSEQRHNGGGVTRDFYFIDSSTEFVLNMPGVGRFHYPSVHSAAGLSWLTEDRRIFSKDQVYAEVYYPVVSQGCTSQICLALSSTEMVTYLELIKTSIDREIKVVLADGRTELVLRPTNLELGSAMALIAHAEYPTSAQSFPFDTE